MLSLCSDSFHSIYIHILKTKTTPHWHRIERRHVSSNHEGGKTERLRKTNQVRRPKVRRRLLRRLKMKQGYYYKRAVIKRKRRNHPATPESKREPETRSSQTGGGPQVKEGARVCEGFCAHRFYYTNADYAGPTPGILQRNICKNNNKLRRTEKGKNGGRSAPIVSRL